MDEELEKFKDVVPYILEDVLVRFLVVTSHLPDGDFEVERCYFVDAMDDYLNRVRSSDEARKIIQSKLDERDMYEMAKKSGLPDEEIQKMMEHRKNVRSGNTIGSENSDPEASNVIAVDFTKK